MRADVYLSAKQKFIRQFLKVCCLGLNSTLKILQFGQWACRIFENFEGTGLDAISEAGWLVLQHVPNVL